MRMSLPTMRTIEVGLVDFLNKELCQASEKEEESRSGKNRNGMNDGGVAVWFVKFKFFVLSLFDVKA